MPEAMFLLGLSALIPDRTLWKDEVLQWQKGSKLGGGMGIEFLCMQLDLKLHFT